MATIRVTMPEDVPAVVTGDVVGDDLRGRMSDGELGSSVRMFHPGGEDALQLFEVEVRPDAVVGQHSHDEDEIIYVVDGELHLGRQVLGPGASVLIPGDTLYSFRAGPDGLRFLNFRGRRDITYRTRDEFMAIRRERLSASDPG